VADDLESVHGVYQSPGLGDNPLVISQHPALDVVSPSMVFEGLMDTNHGHDQITLTTPTADDIPWWFGEQIQQTRSRSASVSSGGTETPLLGALTSTRARTSCAGTDAPSQLGVSTTLGDNDTQDAMDEDEPSLDATRELEARLAAIELSQLTLNAENDRLRRDLERLAVERKIMEAVSTPPIRDVTNRPMAYNPVGFYENLLRMQSIKAPSHRIVSDDEGSLLLAAGATWDLIVRHDLFKLGLVDIADVSERLKGKARSDGQGPVFAERDILVAIEQSVASTADELV